MNDFQWILNNENILIPVVCWPHHVGFNREDVDPKIGMSILNLLNFPYNSYTNFWYMDSYYYICKGWNIVQRTDWRWFDSEERYIGNYKYNSGVIFRYNLAKPYTVEDILQFKQTGWLPSDYVEHFNKKN